MQLSGSMDHEIRPLTRQDEPILWEMLYYGLSSAAKDEQLSRDVVRRPEISRYVEDWGRIGDTGFVAHDKKNRALLGAAWLRRPTDKSDDFTGACAGGKTGAPTAWHRHRSADAIGSRKSRSLYDLGQASWLANRCCVSTSDLDSKSSNNDPTLVVMHRAI